MSTIESKANATQGEEREQGRTRQARPASTHDEQRTPGYILQRMAQEDTPFGRLLRSLPPYYGDFGGELTAQSPQPTAQSSSLTAQGSQLTAHPSPASTYGRGSAPTPSQGSASHTTGGSW